MVSEKGGGAVPVLWVENRSPDQHVFIMGGEVIAGGMQTRTVRRDVVLAPGQKIDLEVFCVEAHRWAGEAKFSLGSKTMLPQSIQGEVRKGADQVKIWSEVARNNATLSAENATGSLEKALEAPTVRGKLDEVRRKIVPGIPAGTTGFIFVAHGRAGRGAFRPRGPCPHAAAQAVGLLRRGLRDPPRALRRPRRRA